jgi:hypothetical protein
MSTGSLSQIGLPFWECIAKQDPICGIFHWVFSWKMAGLLELERMVS